MKIDKILHFVVSGLIVTGLSFYFDSILIPIVTTIGIGFLKEIYDHYFRGGFDLQDFIADVLGVIVALFILSFYKIN